jgi:hypothetical protein
MASWSEVESSAPELAAAIRRCFEANLHHVLGTVRASGAPRLSGTEVEFRDNGEVGVGMMAGSRKLADVLRDPRVEIHSAPLDTDLARGDAKLAGRLVHVGPTDGPDGVSLALDIDVASLVAVRGDELVLLVWRLGEGVREIRRK